MRFQQLKGGLEFTARISFPISSFYPLIAKNGVLASSSRSSFFSLFGCSGDSSFRIIVVGSPSRLKVFSISFISHFVNKGISHVASDLNIPIEIAIALKDIYG